MSAGQAAVKAEPNVTPMIDVMLVLLIIFMIVTPAIAAGFKATMPQGVNLKPHPEDEDEVVLGIDADGQLLPEQAADRERAARGPAQRDLRRAGPRTRSCTSRRTRSSSTAKFRTPSRWRGPSGARVLSRDHRARPRARCSHGREGEEVMAMSAGRPRRQVASEHQRHADDRRAAGAADHLHDHAAAVPQGDRRAGAAARHHDGEHVGEQPDRARAARRRRLRDQHAAGAQGAARRQLHAIYDDRPAKLLFIKAGPTGTTRTSSTPWTWRGRGVQIIGFTPKEAK